MSSEKHIPSEMYQIVDHIDALRHGDAVLNLFDKMIAAGELHSNLEEASVIMSEIRTNK